MKESLLNNKLHELDFDKFKNSFLNFGSYGLFWYYPFFILEDIIYKCYRELNENQKKEKFLEIFSVFYTSENSVYLKVHKSFLDLCERFYLNKNISFADFSQEVEIFSQADETRGYGSRFKNPKNIETWFFMYLDTYKNLDSIEKEKEKLMIKYIISMMMCSIEQNCIT